MFVRYNMVPERPVRRAVQQPVVVYAGRLDKTKGLPLLMAGWYRYRSESRSPWAGPRDRGIGPSLGKRCEPGPPTRPSVRMAGPLIWTPVPRRWPPRRAIVLPSAWEESFGLAAVEAMSLGVAPVAAAHGSFPEIITDEVDGVLFQPGDPAALATMLMRADENYNAFQELRCQGQEDL